MKIIQKHIDTLSKAIDEAIATKADVPLEQLAKNYKANGLTDRRFLFDIWHCSKVGDKSCTSWIHAQDYDHIYDDHIFSALKHIFKNKPLPSKV